MEIVYAIGFSLFTLYLCLEKLHKIIEDLKKNKSTKLLAPGKSLNINLSIISEQKKNEVCKPTNTNSIDNSDE